MEKGERGPGVLGGSNRRAWPAVPAALLGHWRAFVNELAFAKGRTASLWPIACTAPTPAPHCLLPPPLPWPAVNERRDHIPPVVSGSAVTFPFDITVAG